MDAPPRSSAGHETDGDEKRGRRELPTGAASAAGSSTALVTATRTGASSPKVTTRPRRIFRPRVPNKAEQARVRARRSEEAKNEMAAEAAANEEVKKLVRAAEQQQTDLKRKREKLEKEQVTGFRVHQANRAPGVANVLPIKTKRDDEVRADRKNSENWKLKRLSEFEEDVRERIKHKMKEVNDHGVILPKILKDLYSVGNSALSLHRWIQWIVLEAPIYDELLMKVNSREEFVAACLKDPSIKWTERSTGEITPTLTCDEQRYFETDENIASLLAGYEQLPEGTRANFLTRLRSARLVYVWACRMSPASDWLTYVGESCNVKERLKSHFRSAFGKGVPKQNAHKRLQELAANDIHWKESLRSFITGGDLIVATPGGGDIKGAVRQLGISYTDAVREANMEKQPSVTEISTAVGAALFFREALWTMVLKTLNHNAYGLNSSQPASRHDSRQAPASSNHKLHPTVTRYKTMVVDHPEWPDKLQQYMNQGMTEFKAIEHIFAEHMRSAWNAMDHMHMDEVTLSSRGYVLDTLRGQVQQRATRNVKQKKAEHATVIVTMHRSENAYEMEGTVKEPNLKLSKRDFQITLENEQARKMMAELVVDDEFVAVAKRERCEGALKLGSQKHGQTSRHTVHYPLGVIEGGDPGTFNNLLAHGVKQGDFTVVFEGLPFKDDVEAAPLDVTAIFETCLKTSESPPTA